MPTRIGRVVQIQASSSLNFVAFVREERLWKQSGVLHVIDVHSTTSLLDVDEPNEPILNEQV